MLETKSDLKVTATEEEWKMLLKFVEEALQILKGSDDHENSEKVSVS